MGNTLEVLAGIFAVDVLSFAVMSNHLHVVARTWPDIVKEWSDEEVAIRWWNLFLPRRKMDKSPEDPTEYDLNPIRPRIAKTPETSDFTSVKERVADRQIINTSA